MARSRPALIDGQPGAALALRYLRRSFYNSLCHQPGRALDSAVHATAEYVRTLAWTGHDLADCELAAVAVQGAHLWLITTATCAAYLVRPTAGGWHRLTAGEVGSLLAYHTPPQEQTGMATVLQPGDLVLLTTQAHETLIQSCLLSLLLHEPGLGAEDLSDTLTQLSADEPGSGLPLALLLTCQALADPEAQATPPRPSKGTVALAVPAGFPWELDDLPLPAKPRASAVPAPSLVAHPPPHEVSPPPPVPSFRLPRLPADPAPTRQAVTPDLHTWIATQGRLARALAPGTGLLMGAGLAGAWITGQLTYLLAGCSLSGLLLYSAHRLRPAEQQGDGSAAVAKGRLLGTYAVPATVWPRTWSPPVLAAPRRATGRAAHPPVTVGLTWSCDRLLLPPPSAVEPGCLDIVSLHDAAGKAIAELTLLCPPHLLTEAGGYPQGIYVVLHDLVSDRRQMVAWLAPGQRCTEAVLRDVGGYSGNPDAHVRRLRGHPRFEMASTHLRVALMLDRYRFTDPPLNQHIESLEVLLTGTQELA
ncbi:MAG: hypothetical protein ACR2M0_10740 [Chloroflexia bacterium]